MLYGVNDEFYPLSCSVGSQKESRPGLSNLTATLWDFKKFTREKCLAAPDDSSPGIHINQDAMAIAFGYECIGPALTFAR